MLANAIAHSSHSWLSSGEPVALEYLRSSKRQLWFIIIDVCRRLLLLLLLLCVAP
jgi:hypothetical protein